MAKLYKSKPRFTFAEQFFHDQPLPFQDKMAVCFDAGFYVVTIHNQRVYLEDGDYIVPEPDGVHFYPVKPDIFEQNWRLVADDAVAEGGLHA